MDEMETDSGRLESSVWIGKKRYRALLSGWRYSWTELDKKNREKKSSKCLSFMLYMSFIILYRLLCLVFKTK